MKTISIFFLLIYWSIMIFAPFMYKDIIINQSKLNKAEIIKISKVTR